MSVSRQTVQQLQNKVNALTRQVASLQAQLAPAILVAQLLDTKTKITASDIEMPLRSLFQRLREQVDAAAAASAAVAAAFEPRVAGAEAAVAAQEPRLAGAEALLAAQEPRLAGAEATVAAHEARLAGAEATVAAHEARLAGAEASVAVFGASDAAQEARLAAEEAKSAAQEARDAAQDAEIVPLKVELEALKKGNLPALEIAIYNVDTWDAGANEHGVYWSGLAAEGSKLVRLIGSANAAVYGFPAAPAPGAIHRFLNDTAGDFAFGALPYDDVVDGELKRIVPDAVFSMAAGEAYTFVEKDGAWAFVPGF